MTQNVKKPDVNRPRIKKAGISFVSLTLGQLDTYASQKFGGSRSAAANYIPNALYENELRKREKGR